MNKKEFIDKWGCEPDEEAPAFVQEIDSKTHAEFLEDLDQFEQHIKEKCAKEKRILINWLSNLERKIMRHDEFKGLRGYPITHFQEKYIIPKPPKE